jgi:hypothetical protein
MLSTIVLVLIKLSLYRRFIVAKKQVVKSVTDFNVSLFDNGFTLTYSGNDSKNDWCDAKIIVSDVEELCKLIRGIAELPRD